MKTSLTIILQVFLLLNFNSTAMAGNDNETDSLELKQGTISQTTLTTAEIRSLPYRTIEELIGLQNGVVVIQDNVRQVGSFAIQRDAINSFELHVRGGRDYENGFYLNGIRINDPVTGLYIGSFSTYALKRLEFYPGYIPLQFGNATSSVISMQTLSGTDEYRGFAEIFSDNSIGSDFGQNYYTAGISGPIPGINKGSMFGLVERRKLDDRNPSWITDKSLPESPNRLPNNWNESWAYHAKLDYDFSEKIILSAHLDGSNSEWSEYLHSYYFNIEHTPYHDDDNLLIGSILRFELEPEKTNFSLSASYFMSERFSGDGVYRQDLWAYGRPGGNPRNLNGNLFRSFDDPTTPVITDTMTVDGQVRSFVIGGDEGRVYSNYLKHKSEVVSLRGRLQHQFSKTHSTVMGIEYSKSTIRYYQHLFPTTVWRGSTGSGFQDAINYGYDEFGNETDPGNWENETKHPTELSFFIEDKLDFGRVELMGGGRLDIFDYATLAPRNPALPLDPDSLQFDTITTNDTLIQTLDLGDLEKVDKFIRLSINWLLKIPFSEAFNVHISSGVNYQKAPYQFIYNDYDYFSFKIRTGGYYIALGNSSLEPQKSSFIEGGARFEWDNNSSVEFNVYFKERSGQIQVFSQPSLPTSFATYRNSDEVDIFGIELFADIKTAEHARLRLGYTYSDATGSGSYASSFGNFAWVNSNVPNFTVPPLDYDQTHKLVGMFELDFRNKESNGLNQAGFLEGFLLNFIVKAGSGLPYTPMQVFNEATLFPFLPIQIDTRNSRRGDWTATIDFRLEKTFQRGHIQLTPYVSANNLFNRANVADVWNGTGEPNTTGWLTTPEGETFVQVYSQPDRTGLTGEEKYQIKQQLPINYWNPRQYYFGLRVSF
ncbi:MAG: TonB-dependent receptor [candidate division Zixibacteria bacterium]|nr:TonB-dependent receptor [candidate division Zixibacteria bacterium]